MPVAGESGVGGQGQARPMAIGQLTQEWSRFGGDGRGGMCFQPGAGSGAGLAVQSPNQVHGKGSETPSPVCFQ